MAYENLGFVDKAVGDYGEAIRLDPQLMVAFSDRGVSTPNWASFKMRSMT